MDILSIILFFIYTYGLGYSVTRSIKNDLLEITVMRIGIGLGIIPVLGILLNLVHIPIDWRIVFALSLFLPLKDLIRFCRIWKLPSKIPKPSKPTLILLGIFLVCVLIYCKGPFAYPWLEDDDPWTHAAGIKYVTIERNLNVPPGEFDYINPYPPGYDLLFGILHQTSPSLYWTMKFFNGLIISLGYLFFFFFIKEFSKDTRKALFATFFLAAIPCYLSHFIWAHSLVITLFFPALYTLYKATKDRHFVWPSSLVIAGILMTQPSQSFKFFILIFLLFISTLVIKKKWNKNFISIVLLSTLISLIWWGPTTINIVSGKFKYAMREGTTISGNKKNIRQVIQATFDPAGGSATRSYTVQDYTVVTEHNMINNPLGIGTTLLLLAFCGMPFCFQQIKRGEPEEKTYSLVILLWLTFTFLGMNSKTFHLPVGLVAFRFWMLFAIPVVLLAAETSAHIWELIKRPLIKTLIFICIILSVLLTSGYAKYKVNTGFWPWGVYWSSYKELDGYMWLRRTLPPDTKIFSFSDNLLVIGHDMHADFWTEDYKASFRDAIDMELLDLHAALTRKSYEYIIVGQREVKKFGLEVVNDKLISLNESKLFQLSHSTENGARIYRVTGGSTNVHID